MNEIGGMGEVYVNPNYASGASIERTACRPGGMCHLGIANVTHASMQIAAYRLAIDDHKA
jgi:hypothetical protein